MSIYGQLLELGHTDEEIRAAAEAGEDADGRNTLALLLTDTPDGEPIVAIKHTIDGKYEEEAGLGKLFEMINGKTQQEAHFVRGECNEFVLSLSRVNSQSLPYLNRSLSSFRGRNTHMEGYYTESDTLKKVAWDNATVTELRALAKTLGVSLRGATKKDEIRRALFNSDEARADAKNVFQAFSLFNGSVFCADPRTKLLRNAMTLIWEAAKTDSVRMGGGTMNPFGSGSIVLFSGLDVGPKLQAEWDAEAAFVKKHMDALAPVEAELKDAGFRFYALCNPSEIKGANGTTAVHYWMNSYSLRELGGKQAYGWFTLEELKSRSFLDKFKNQR